MSKHGNNRVATSLQRGRVGNGFSNGKEKIFADGKLHWSIAFVPMLTVFLCVWYSLVCFPYTQSMMEQLNFYVNTSEFVGSKLAESLGLNGLLSSWLLQFFHNSNVGAAIEAMLLSLVCLLASLVPVAWHNTVYGLTRKASGPLCCWPPFQLWDCCYFLCIKWNYISRRSVSSACYVWQVLRQEVE